MTDTDRLPPLSFDRNARPLRPDEPCAHRGCLSHVTHPCEGCGRIAGRYPEPQDAATEPPR